MANDPTQAAQAPVRIEGEVDFAGTPTFQALPKQLVGRVKLTATEPSVKNVENFVCQNVGAVTITDFKDGQEGQPLYLLGDGQTTLQHGTKIVTHAGTDLLLANGKGYFFKRLSGAWRQI